jgi:alkylated DNA repair protein (DNA oxidative demethylase)
MPSNPRRFSTESTWAPHRRPRPRTPGGTGHFYYQDFLTPSDRDAILEYLGGLHPIWESRYPEGRALPPGKVQRRLLRPVYWLGSWQFACLEYYRPPRGTSNRCVAAEPFPPVLARLVAEIEGRIVRLFPASDIPPGFRLNTCLVNFYGNRLEHGRSVDVARVGEHRDFEPGPVASLSIGERALFQFVARGATASAPLLSQWLDDGSLQIFGGPAFKDRALHRVQRVARNAALTLPPQIDGFRTRRVNFTFRYVPREHVVPFGKLDEPARSDVRPYVEELARHSRFFERALL